MDEVRCSTSAAAFDTGPVVGTTVTGQTGITVLMDMLLTRRLHGCPTLKHCYSVSSRPFIDGTAPCTRRRYL